MEDSVNFIEPLIEKAEAYGKTSLNLIKHKTIDKTTQVLSNFVSRAVVLFVVSISLLFLNFGLALWLGELFGKSYYGFFCIAGLYIILGLILYFPMHKWIKKCTADSFVRQFFN